MVVEKVDNNYVTIDGIFIKQDFEHLILDEEEIDKYTLLTKSTLKQTLFIPFKYDIQILNFYLHSYFADIQVAINKNHELKYTLKFKIEEIELFYFEKAQML